MPVKITPVPTVPQKPNKPKGGFFHGLHVVWVIIIGLLAWQNFSQSADIRELKQRVEAQNTVMLQMADWMDNAETYLHRHY